MRYDEVEGLPPGQFKRLTGVKRETFERMLAVLRQREQQKKRSGRPSKLSPAEQLWLRLMYWREYRTQFHIAQSYGIHEANAKRIIRKVEGALADSGEFKLPGKRAVRADEGVEISFVIVDVTETPIERPKKSKSSATAARKSGTPSYGHSPALVGLVPKGARAAQLGNTAAHRYKLRQRAHP